MIQVCMKGTLSKTFFSTPTAHKLRASSSCKPRLLNTVSTTSGTLQPIVISTPRWIMMSYQRGEGHKVLWGLRKLQREERVAGVRSRGEGPGLAGGGFVAAEEESLSPGAHAHQGLGCLQIRVLQRGRAAAGSTGDGMLAVMSPSLHTRLILLHVFSLKGKQNDNNRSDFSTSLFKIQLSPSSCS